MAEDWKDGKPDKQWYMTPHGPAQLDAQQLQEMKDNIEAERLIGEQNYPVLPEYHSTKRCIMCGFEMFFGQKELQYCASGIYGLCLQAAGHHPHIHVTCKHCSYLFFEKVYRDSPSAQRHR